MTAAPAASTGAAAAAAAGTGVAPGAAYADVAPDDIATLLFTSGTTGTPKAVPLTHANLVANASALKRQRLVEPSDRVLVPLPLHHTYPLTVGVLTVLGKGATVILPAGISGPEIAHASKTAGATIMLAVPRLCTALWDGIAANVRARGRNAERVFRALLRVSIAVRRATGRHVGGFLFKPLHARLGPALELIGCGGAKLPAELTWRLEGLGFTVLTGYGLTETSPVCTFNERGRSKPGTEGRPLPGVEVTLGPSAPGQAGEILVRGPNVFSGYLDDPEATAAAFTQDGRFRTGDLGEIDADGFLRVVGRSKELIVLADGKKLFPETVEKKYAESPLIAEIAVFEHAGSLAALIVTDERALRERGALREAALVREALEEIGEKLPPYQRIAGAYRLSREPLPRTQLGKLKRHLLPDLYRGTGAHEHREEARPLGADDEALLAAAKQRGVLPWLEQRYPDKRIELTTSPQLDLQIDSLEWVTISTEVEQRFGVGLTSEAVARILTVRDLLAEIQKAAPAASLPAAPPYVVPGAFARAVGTAVYVIALPVVRMLFKLRVEGREHLAGSGALVLTPNHASYLDPFVIAAALPLARLRETFWAGWVGIMFASVLSRLASRVTQVFPVDPNRDLRGALTTAQRLLDAGKTVVWFPEGRRSPDGRMDRFNAGAALLVQGTPHAAVPTAVIGAHAAWPRGQRWPRRRPVTVRFGPPLSFAAEPENDREATERVRAALERAVRGLLPAESIEAGGTDGSANS